jgi:hypothetical protein
LLLFLLFQYRLKWLVVVSPQGRIVYVSDAYLGSISDVDITNVCGVLLNPQLFCASKGVMADKGFTIDALCSEFGRFLIVPPRAFKGERQFKPEAVILTKLVASRRIYVGALGFQCSGRSLHFISDNDPSKILSTSSFLAH